MGADPADISDDFLLIPCKPYGGEGLKPSNADECPYGGEISCVSGSGGSICGGFWGTAHKGKYVLCNIAFRESVVIGQYAS